MLEHFFQTPFALGQLRSGLSGPYIDGFAQKLKDEGYSPWTAGRLIRPAVHLGHFVQLSGQPLTCIDEDTLSVFQQHKPCGCPYFRGDTSGRGARVFVDYLRDLGVVKTRERKQMALSSLRMAAMAFIDSFQQWLGQTAGLAESTQYRYGRRVLALVDCLGSDPSQYNAEKLRRFILEYSRRCGRAGTANVCTAVRALLRYLAAQGLCQAGLEYAIPPLPGWRGTALPKYLSPSEVERALGTCDVSSTRGLRDRAIVLLLARLGLRAGDVAALRLDDIDWRHGSLVVSGKTPRQVRLPLPQEVGEAVLSYLHKRPPLNTDAVFIRTKAPLGPLRSVSVSAVVAKALRQAGIKARSYGAHLLRHTAATHMLRQGVPLSAISAVLRHRSQDMTAHYAKVDLDLLNLVVQPWPEV